MGERPEKPESVACRPWAAPAAAAEPDRDCASEALYMAKAHGVGWPVCAVHKRDHEAAPLSWFKPGFQPAPDDVSTGDAEDWAAVVGARIRAAGLGARVRLLRPRGSTGPHQLQLICGDAPAVPIGLARSLDEAVGMLHEPYRAAAATPEPGGPQDYPLAPDRGRALRAMMRLLLGGGCLSVEIVPERHGGTPPLFGVRVVTPCGCPVVRAGGADVGALLEAAEAFVAAHLREHKAEGLDG